MENTTSIQTEFCFDTAIPPQPWSVPSTAAGDKWQIGKIKHSVPYITTPGFPPKPALEAGLDFYVLAQRPDVIRQELGIYNEAELAAALGVTADTLGQWRAKKTGPQHTKRGKAVFYVASHVRAWIASGRE